MSARRARLGSTKSLRPPEGQQWAWITVTMLGSITHKALGIHARRLLDFLMNEHARNGGRENGKLAAPYRQLAAWGLTEADVPKGLAELFATGFARRTQVGLRQAGGGEPALYALTWLPTMVGSRQEVGPTHDWLKVIEKLHEEKVGNVAQARQWLKAQVAAQNVGRGSTARARTARKATPQAQVSSPPKCQVAE